MKFDELLKVREQELTDAVWNTPLPEHHTTAESVGDRLRVLSTEEYMIKKYGITLQELDVILKEHKPELCI